MWSSAYIYIHTQVSQEWRSLIQDLIPELILSQKRHVHMGPVRTGSGVNEFLKYSK